MKTFPLKSTILHSKWLLDPLFALNQGPLIASLLNPQMATEEGKPEKMMAYAVDAKTITGVRYSYWDGFDRAPEGSVAVIRVQGVMMKDDQYCGPVGTETLGRIVKSAEQHPNIDAIVLQIDSPGGTVDGTETFANLIKNTSKPVVTFVDGMMCSAALWVGTSANEIMASTELDEIGSVGVLVQFADLQPYYEKEGIVFHLIKASTSPDKVKMWEDVRAGKYEAYIKEILDPIDQKFMEVIRENRPAVEDKHLTGKTFFARDVMGVFVDSIGTIEDAILRASELANPSDNNQNSNTKIKRSMDQFIRINAVLGVESLESVDESVSLNEEQLNLIEAALVETDSLNGQLETERQNVTSAQTERDQARTDLTNAISAFDAIDATIAAAQTPEAKVAAIRTLLSSKPAVQPAGNLDKKDHVDDGVDWETIDNLPHNKAVDANT